MNCIPGQQNDQVLADGEPAGADQVVPILPPCGARSEGPAGGRRGSLLLGPHEGPGDRLTVKYTRKHLFSTNNATTLLSGLFVNIKTLRMTFKQRKSETL